ncbi:DUF3800 domain-containing protein (plasmid) [Ligilactobacillus salivarius]|uniref:DUF3800 domain-containing protein n=1 Tax=Ligilactobacillus salivarius TaxID=1624 RepID=A0ABD7YXT1_9LACO|nr:DUF3800 domain-containing protein [Ligilactobacillus salivarius]WHS04960.1 DUF3800 domain-containing protein [Ligilactobacillus salivarius]WHS09047.1 DUF3800 domain-containing protein [Ligilactobacillus salivarius]WHS11268.1 DUF3800 domain-containing protein [Ligilactobacillus salivarius]WHS15113.1 DUF3800 domain-containing protein [Ligilactobacillus salivarius]WHS18738.1 DUF3800 domain-containing protein [Ligilactobacillus salivarius]
MKNWDIYVDETFGGSGSGSYWITSFIGIPSDKKEKIFKDYHDLVYQYTDRDEVKGREVSDRLNTKALMVLKNKGCVFAINKSRKNNVLFEKSKDMALINIAHYLQYYIYPLKHVIYQICRNKCRDEEEFNLNIYLDKASFVESEAFQRIAIRIISKMLTELCEKYEIKIDFELSLLDSKSNMGIQLADMLCSAYRKNISYCEVEGDVELIPFKYFLKIQEVPPLDDVEFLSTYALVKILVDIEGYSTSGNYVDSSNNTLPSTEKLNTLISEIRELDEQAKKEDSVKQRYYCQILDEVYLKYLSNLPNMNSISSHQTKSIEVITNFDANINKLKGLYQMKDVNWKEITDVLENSKKRLQKILDTTIVDLVLSKKKTNFKWG